MLFNSFFFIFTFLPLTLFLFFTISKYSQQGALLILLLASFLVYAWHDYHFIYVLLLSITVNFIISNYLANNYSLLTRKNLLWIGIVFNLSLLCYFKYTDFFIHNVNHLFNTRWPSRHIVLPIGISFFTFTQIAFLIDQYRGSVLRYNFMNYALFVTYFPHLIAGPIIHHKEVMPQFNKKKIFTFNARYGVLGFILFTIGLFKKTVLADRLGCFVGPVFDTALQHIAMIDAWTAALAYTLELYFDFSGYADMAVGLSLFIGVKLPINFYSPYQSINIIEFWRRWNMTLSRFLRDYLYIPLGGNKKGNRYVNLMITMLLGGLWHGANWTFVIWGFLHGTYLCINHGWQQLKVYLGISAANSFIVSMLSRLLTFFAVLIAWIFFRADTFSKAYQIFHAMFMEKLNLPLLWRVPNAVKIGLQKMHVTFTTEHLLVASNEAMLLIAMSLSIVWLLPNSYQFLRRYRPASILNHKNDKRHFKTFTWKPVWLWHLIVAFIFVVSILHIQSSSIFLYFQF